MGSRESIPAPLRLDLSGAAALHDATAEAHRFAGVAGLTVENASRLAIVVEELVANLYDHGGLGANDVFTLELSATGRELLIVLEDTGTPFDPRSAEFDAHIPSRGGGAGLRLIQAWASRMDYRSKGGRNRLSLRLPRG